MTEEIRKDFEVYDSTTIFDRRGKPPVVQIAKWGHIRFSVEATKLLKLKPEDRITFLTPKGDKEIIYFKKHPGGLPLSQTSQGKSGIGVGVCCRALTRRLLNFLGSKRSITFDVTPETADVYGEKMWFLLTSKIHQPIQWRKHG